MLEFFHRIQANYDFRDFSAKMANWGSEIEMKISRNSP